MRVDALFTAVSTVHADKEQHRSHLHIQPFSWNCIKLCSVVFDYNVITQWLLISYLGFLGFIN